MSSSEPVFTARSSFKQQNGDVAVAPIRATMESIKSVHENPFYKNFGIKHSAPPYARQVNQNRSVGVSEEQKPVSSNGRSSSVDDDIGEYRPGSGYVHKLLDKFSSLTVREEQIIPGPHLKRSSSLDELPVENEVVKNSAAISRTVGLGYEKPSFLSAAKLSQRARSIEGLNQSHYKSHHGITVSHQYVDTKWGMDNQLFTHKFQRDSQIVPPDVNLVRDDINIERIKSAALLENADENERYDDAVIVISGHESVIQDELPKPNTVLTVRNIFESASSGVVLYTRRQRSDSPSFVSMQSVKPAVPPLQELDTFASSQESGWNRNSSHSSSPLASPKYTSDTHPKATSSSLSKAENMRQTSDSDLPSRPNAKKSVAAISSISGMNISRPQTSPLSSPYRTNANPTSPSAFSPTAATDGRLFRFDRESTLEASGTSDNLHHSSSHSASSSNVIVTGAQLYTSALSSNQKSSHAISSSSFKDKHEDGKHYEHPVMIFEKSNLSPKRSKSQRTRDYTPLSDGVEAFSEEAHQFRDANHSKEIKASFEDNDYSQSALETSNKVRSQKKFFEPNSKLSDKNTSNQSNSVPARNQTIIEVKSSLKSVLHHEQSNLEDKSNNVASEASSAVVTKKSNVRKPRRQELSAESQPVTVVSNSRENKKRVTFAVIPKDQDDDDEKPVSHSSDDITTNREFISDTNKDTVGTDQSYQSEPPGLNEKPINDVSNTDTNSQEQPVKGIPSIIAQRLKQQYVDPSQVAEDVRSSDAHENLNEASKKYLGSVSGKTALSDSNETASLSTEIENEITNVRKKIEESRSKSAGLVPIFDSSQLSKKRKQKKKQQASTSEEVVPALSFSGITDGQGMDYQPPNKKIAPCNIVFVGENAKTSRSLLMKQRKVKINIHFNDGKTETFEYPSEALALEHYLEEHPHEKEDILVLEDFTGGGDESSDDVQIDVFENPVKPRGNAEDDLLKSNTSLAHTGSLQSYRGRFQQDYELGTVQMEEPKKLVEPEPVFDPDKVMLRPADEDDTNTWSTSSSADILF